MEVHLLSNFTCSIQVCGLIKATILFRPIPTKQFWQQMESTHLLYSSISVVTYSGVAGLPLDTVQALKGFSIIG